MARAGQQPVEAGRISGEVLDAVTGEPLNDARVILQSRGSANQQQIVTNNKGLFVFEGVQPGSYLLHAERTGYVTGRLPPGYARPIPLSIAWEAGRQQQVSLRLVRTTTISGRVYDVDRQALANVELEILLPQYNGFGQRMLTRLNIVSPRPDGYPSVQTDDRGEYRFTGIPAGEYYIRAAYRAEPARPAGVAVRANNAAPTYYPGVISPDEAVPIKVASGTDLQAIDFTLAPISPFKISRRIINPLTTETRAVYDYYLIPRNRRVVEDSHAVPNKAATEKDIGRVFIKIVRLDESCTSNPKSEVSNWT